VPIVSIFYISYIKVGTCIVHFSITRVKEIGKGLFEIANKRQKSREFRRKIVIYEKKIPGSSNDWYQYSFYHDKKYKDPVCFVTSEPRLLNSSDGRNEHISKYLEGRQKPPISLVYDANMWVRCCIYSILYYIVYLFYIIFLLHSLVHTLTRP